MFITDVDTLLFDTIFYFGFVGVCALIFAFTNTRPCTERELNRQAVQKY